MSKILESEKGISNDGIEAVNGWVKKVFLWSLFVALNSWGLEPGPRLRVTQASQFGLSPTHPFPALPQQVYSEIKT